jgi:hypothetical protein
MGTAISQLAEPEPKRRKLVEVGTDTEEFNICPHGWPQEVHWTQIVDRLNVKVDRVDNIFRIVNQQTYEAAEANMGSDVVIHVALARAVADTVLLPPATPQQKNSIPSFQKC